MPMTPICHLYRLRYWHTDRNRYLVLFAFTCCDSWVVNLHGIKTGIVYIWSVWSLEGGLQTSGKPAGFVLDELPIVPWIKRCEVRLAAMYSTSLGS